MFILTAYKNHILILYSYLYSTLHLNCKKLIKYIQFSTKCMDKLDSIDISIAIGIIQGYNRIHRLKNIYDKKEMLRYYINQQLFLGNAYLQAYETGDIMFTQA